MRAATLALAVAACRFSAAAAPDAHVDTAVDTVSHDSPVDAGSAASCWSIWEHGTPSFSAPVELTGLLPGDQGNGFQERDPFITADNLALYFSSDISDMFEVYVATRGSAGASFGSALPEVAIDNVATSASKISLTADGTIAVYASNVNGDDDLFESDVADNVVAAGTAVNLTMVDNGSNQGDPSLTPSGDHLYFSDTDGNGDQFLAMTARTGSGDSAFGAETTTPFAKIMADGAQDYADPSISGDELVLVFTEYDGSVDSVFYATRGSAGDAFGSARPISVADTTSFNDDGQLSADGCTLYFASDRSHNDIQKIYVTTISP